MSGNRYELEPPLCIEPRPILFVLVLEQLQLTWFTLQPT